MRRTIVGVVCCGLILLGYIKKDQNKVLSCVISLDEIECLVLPQDVIALKQDQIVYFQIENQYYQAIIESISQVPIVETTILYPITLKSSEYQSTFQHFPIKVIYIQYTSNWLSYLLSKII